MSSKKKKRASKIVVEPPLVQPPSTRQGIVRQSHGTHWGSRDILDWSEGTTLQLGGPLASPPQRGVTAIIAGKKPKTPPPEIEAKAGGAIRVGNRVVRLPHAAENPRVHRRKRKLPPTRALLPFNAAPGHVTDQEWQAYAAGRGSASMRFPDEPTVSVLTYQLLSSERSAEMGYIREDLLEGRGRRARALQEVLNYSADIICLQDVDEAHEFWEPQLSVAGYDSMFVPRSNYLRPRGNFAEGVLLSWDRNLFSLARSDVVELNDLFKEMRSIDPVLAQTCLTDHVAALALLVPWQDSKHTSALCVCNALLCGGQIPKSASASADATREAQAKFLTKRIERFNADFGAPVLLCGGLESAPMSPAYEILASGCLAADPSPPKKPPYAPEAIAHSPTSVLLRWLPPPLDLEALEPPREGFWVSWRGGGAKSLGWKEQAYVTESNATVYDLVATTDGARTVKSARLQFIVTGLASSTPYEFRFCAVNELGSGPWSEPSAAVATTLLGANYPKSQALLTLDQWNVRFMQGDPSLQALLLAAKEADIVTTAEIKSMRSQVRNGTRSEFYFVQKLLKGLKVNRVSIGRYLSTFDGTLKPFVDPEEASIEAMRKVPVETDTNNQDLGLSRKPGNGVKMKIGPHPYASTTNLSPRYEGTGDSHAQLPAVRKQELPFFPAPKQPQITAGPRGMFRRNALPRGGGAVAARAVNRQFDSQASPLSMSPSPSLWLEDDYDHQDDSHLEEACVDDDRGGYGKLHQLTLESSDDAEGYSNDILARHESFEENHGSSFEASGLDMNAASAAAAAAAVSAGLMDESELEEDGIAAAEAKAAQEVEALAELEKEMREEQVRALAALGGGHSNSSNTGGGHGGGSDHQHHHGSHEKHSVTGVHESRQQHRLLLRSAYDCYAWDGEPSLTTCTMDYAGTLDYIMYSTEKLVPVTLLSVPDLTDLLSEDPRQLEMELDDSLATEPPNGWANGWKDNNQNTTGASAKKSAVSSSNQPLGAPEPPPGFGGRGPMAYSGSWVGGIRPNRSNKHHFLPNADYPSSHLALLAEFRFLPAGLEAKWPDNPDPDAD